MAHEANVKKLNEFLLGVSPKAIVANILRDIATDLLNGDGEVELKRSAANNQLIVEIDHDDFIMKLKLYE